MEIFQDDNNTSKLFIWLTQEEGNKMELEAQRSGALTVRTIRRVIEWGIANYPYREKGDREQVR